MDLMILRELHSELLYVHHRRDVVVIYLVESDTNARVPSTH